MPDSVICGETTACDAALSDLDRNSKCEILGRRSLIFVQSIVDAGGKLVVIAPTSEYRDGLSDSYHAKYDGLFKHAVEGTSGDMVGKARYGCDQNIDSTTAIVQIQQEVNGKWSPIQTNQPQSWDDFLDEVADVLAAYVVDIYRRPEVAVISTPTERAGDQSGRSIRLDDLGDGSVKVSTGWYLSVVATYDLEEPENASQAAQIVAGICSGNAEEYAVTDRAGSWVGVGWLVRYQRGETGQTPDGADGIRAARRIEAWPLRSAAT